MLKTQKKALKALNETYIAATKIEAAALLIDKQKPSNAS